MKALILSMFLAAITVTAQSQTDKGTVLLGTSTKIMGTTTSLLMGAPNSLGLGFGSSKYVSDDYEGESSKFLTFNLTPNIGYFFTDRFALGLEGNFSLYSFSDLDASIIAYSVGPFARHYFDTKKSLKPYIEASVAFGQIIVESEVESNTLDVGGNAGVAFFLGEMVSLDVFAGYNWASSKDKETENNAREIAKAFNLGVGISIFL